MIVSHLLQILSTIAFWYVCRKENRRRDLVQGVESGAEDDRDFDATAFSDMTDRENLNFRYIH